MTQKEDFHETFYKCPHGQKNNNKRKVDLFDSRGPKKIGEIGEIGNSELV